MTTDELNRILDDHRKWLSPFKDGGSRADLRDADLRRADLCGASLRDADLRRADLCGANLNRANLCGADLCDADLRGADLCDANLNRANLCGADLCDADLPAFGIPDEGELIVWKRVAQGIAKIKVPADAKRTSSLIGRKCRAEYVETIAIYDNEGNEINESPGRHDNTTIYRVGEITKPDKYDDDIRVECSHGIHFFLTKAEAEQW